MKLKSNTALNMAAMVISSGLNFLATLVWTRLLDPQSFGLYALVSASAILLNAMLFEWLRLVGARTLYDSAEPDSISPLRANALFAIYGSVTVAFVTVGAILCLLDVGFADVAAHWWPVMIGFVLTDMALAIINTVSRLRMKAWQFFWSLVCRSVGSILLGLLLVMYFDMGAAGALLGIVAAQTVVAIGGMLLDPMYRRLRPWKASREQLSAAWLLGYPLIASCALTYAAGLADRFLIGSTLGAHAVGLYAAPVDLLQKTLVFMMMTINLTGYPALVRAYEDRGAEAATATLDRNLQLQLGLGLPAVVGLMVLAPGIVNMLLGEAFRAEGARLLPLVGAAALLRCMITFHLQMAFQVTRKTKLMIVPPVITLIVLVPAGLAGIRMAGLPGMALAAVGAQMICYAITAVLAKRVLPFRILTRDTVKIIGAAAGMGAVLFPFAHLTGVVETLALIAVGGAVYAVLLIVLRVEPILAMLRGLPGFKRLLPRA